LRPAWSWQLTIRGGLLVDMAGPGMAKKAVRKGCICPGGLVEERALGKG